MSTVKFNFCPEISYRRQGNLVYHVKCNEQVCSYFSGVFSEGSVYTFRNFTGQPPQLFALMKELTESLHQQNRVSTAANYRATLRSFQRFRNGVDISLNRIDRALMEEYQSYLRRCGLSLNSVSFYFRILRAVYNRAVELGLIVDCRPFTAVFTGMEKTRKRALYDEDLRRIRILDLRSQPELEFARDIFIFLFFCRGMSFIDAAFLRKTDIKSGNIVYRRRKTGQRLEIKVINQIANIINHYSDPKSPYLLPIIKHPGRNERRQYETALRRVNNALKTIGLMIGLSIPLTTYVSRHSWASIAKKKNVPIAVISDALGHESVATTQIYLDSIDTAAIDRANEIVIGDI